MRITVQTIIVIFLISPAKKQLTYLKYLDDDTCLDFRPDPELEGKQFVDFLGIGGSDDQELREPQGARYVDSELVIERVTYNGEEIIQPPQRWSREQQLELLDTHPMFTGKCPQCGYIFERDYSARVHYDCPDCGWIDDNV